MSTSAFKVYSNVEQQTIYDRPIEYLQIDYYKAKKKLTELLVKYKSQGLSIKYNKYETELHSEFLNYFEVIDTCHDEHYVVYLERIEIFG